MDTESPAQRLTRRIGTDRVAVERLMAEISAGAYADFDEVIGRESTSFVLILDGITDPQNFGAILRVADGFGVHVVVVPEHDSVGLTPAAVKASAGASEWVPVAQVKNLARTIEQLQKSGYWVYAASADGDPPSAIDFTGKVALVLGSDGKGIRRNVLEHCDRVVTIPMEGHVDSFNVATAAAARVSPYHWPTETSSRIPLPLRIKMTSRSARSSHRTALQWAASIFRHPYPYPVTAARKSG